MMRRAVFIAVVAALAVAPCQAGKVTVRDGSTMDKAIPLKERGMKAIEEQMQWMMKLYGYTPWLATLDLLHKSPPDALQKPLPPMPWDHTTLNHHSRCCSHWSFKTPTGQRKIYFDTGVPFTVPEVGRQESSCWGYFADHLKVLWTQ
jgi:hypothetical protein